MKPPLPRTLSAVPRTLHVQIEIAKAIHTLFGQDEQHQRLAESATINNTYWEIGQELRLACRQWLLAHSQPHVINSNAAKAAVDDPKHPGWPAKLPMEKEDSSGPRTVKQSSQQTSRGLVTIRVRHLKRRQRFHPDRRRHHRPSTISSRQLRIGLLLPEKRRPLGISGCYRDFIG